MSNEPPNLRDDSRLELGGKQNESRLTGSRLRRMGDWLRQASTREYVPWTEPYIRWLRHPLALLLLADVACGLCGVLLHPNGFLLVTAVTTQGQRALWGNLARWVELRPVH